MEYHITQIEDTLRPEMLSYQNASISMKTALSTEIETAHNLTMQEMEHAFRTKLDDLKSLNDQNLQQEIERMEREYAARLKEKDARLENESAMRDCEELMDEKDLAILSRDNRIGDSYVNVCEQRIRAFKTEVKSMFQNQIDEMALENKNWLKSMVDTGRLDEEGSMEIEEQAKEKLMGSWEYDIEIPIIERDAVKSLKKTKWGGKTVTEILREARQRDLERKMKRENVPLSRRARALARERVGHNEFERPNVPDGLPLRPRKRQAIEQEHGLQGLTNDLPVSVASASNLFWASNRIASFKSPHIPLPMIPPTIYSPPMPYVTPAFGPNSNFANAPVSSSYSGPSFTPINKCRESREIQGVVEIVFGGKK